MPDLSYTLLVDGSPADANLLEALQQIEVEDHVELADILRLRFAVAGREDGSGWTVLDEDLFPRLAKLKMLVTVGSGPSEPLLEAYVIETHAQLSNQPGQSVFEVVAMDATVLMDLEEKIRAWPDMADSDIAQAIFGEYGLLPEVETTQPSRVEADLTTIQRDTDIRFLRQLALRNGFECYVETDPVMNAGVGFFGPPRLQEPSQGVLSVNFGEATNVNSLSARNDMLKPTTAAGAGLEAETYSDQEGEAEQLDLDALGAEPTLSGDQPRRVLLHQTGLALSDELQTYAQAVVDRSAWGLTVEGELNTAAYGAVLRAKRPVLLRGAGPNLSGTYYVQRVLHLFNENGHTQRFTLRRNALGLDGSENFVTDNALAT